MPKPGRQRFKARLHVAGRDIHLGRWPSQRAADIARDRAVLKLKIDSPLRYPKEARKLGPAKSADDTPRVEVEQHGQVGPALRASAVGRAANANQPGAGS